VLKLVWAMRLPARCRTRLAASSKRIVASPFQRGGYGRGRGVGRDLGTGMVRGVGVGRTVAVGVGLGVTIGVGLTVGVGVAPPAGAWIAIAIGDPVLKKSIVAFVACGG
jgi:hypothetical protein